MMRQINKTRAINAITRQWRLLAVACSAFFALSVNTVLAQTLDVEGAWVRLAPPGMSNYAAYMQLENRSHQLVTIVAVSADCCAMAMFHRNIKMDDMVNMEQISNLQLAPGANFILKPGEAHLMLMHSRKNLLEGDKVEIHFEFADGSAQSLVAPVLRQEPGPRD